MSHENPYSAPSTNVEPSSPPLETTGQQSPYGPWRSTRGLALTLTLLFGVFMIIRVVDGFHSYREILQIEEHGYLYMEDEPNPLEQLGQMTVWTTVGIGILLMIIWCVWTNKTCKNAWFIRYRTGRYLTPGADNTFTPGWYVGWFFVPIANLWKPFQAMSFIRDNSQNLAGKTMGNALGLWWTFWIISTITDRISTNLYKADTFDGYVTASWFNIYSIPIDLLAALFALLVVRKLTAIQSSRAQELNLH